MFDANAAQPVANNKTGNLIVSGLALVALGLIGMLFYVANSKPEAKPILTNPLRAGTAEFESYKGKIELVTVETIVHPNMIGMKQYQVKGRLTNRGDRTLSGLEIAAQMIDLSDKVIKELVSYPVPRFRTDPLKPGEAMNFSIKLDGPAHVTEDDIKTFVLELRGLQF